VPAVAVMTRPRTSRDAPLTLALADVKADMLEIAGGKAVNLGILLRAGFRVPDGKCVTTAAYTRVVGDRLAPVTERLCKAAGDPAALDQLAAEARDIVLAAPVPPDVLDAVRRTELGPVAVRSSATAEDLPFASFAGQQDTYLNVVGADAVLDAVRRCWASLWTDRAVAYRSANGIDHATARLAVVVQQMVQAEVAGVMFTANPVTGRRGEIVVDASPGLGEAVVSGAVNPDHFVVDVGARRVLHRRLGDKRTSTRARPSGGVEQVPGTRSGASLTDSQLEELAALGAEVEAAYAAPQDIEWALDAQGRYWLTQARPITTLYPVPEGRGGPRVFFSVNVAQGVYRPLTPAGAAAIEAISTSVARLWGITVSDPLGGAPAVTMAAGRLFVDVTTPLRNPVGRLLLPRVLDVMEARSATLLRALSDDPRFAPVPSSRWDAVGPLAGVAAASRLPFRLLSALADPDAAHRRVDEVGAALRGRLHPPPDATPIERLEHVERLLPREFAPLALELLPRAGAGFVALGLAAWLLGGRRRPGELSTVMRSLPGNVTTEMDLALWRLAQEIGRDPDSAALVRLAPVDDLVDRYHAGTLPPAVHRGLRAFLRSYGDRSVAEIDLGLPRWREDPSYLFGVLAGYLSLDDDATAPDAVFRRGRLEAEEMVDTLAERAGGIRGQLVRLALGRARALAGLRELPKFHLVTMLASARRELLTVGADLERRELLDSADDVFFLDLREVGQSLAGVPFTDTVRSRRAEYARELRRRHVPRVLLSDGTEPEAVAQVTPPDDGAMHGTAASAGAVTARATVVLDPHRVRLEPGRILVCPSTDPGWTPLFLTAGGLVMEMGGANSHGAVVAREYGIPAVVGVPGATDAISTDDEVTVDGTSGTVRVG
jgi:phosphohistidine swiveling domain-containing protein